MADATGTMAPVSPPPFLYRSADEWLAAPRKRVLLFGMSGVGKTHIAARLRSWGKWFHYSVDYRIGTRYLGEEIADHVKREAMRVPFLRELLLSDSVQMAPNITFANLAAVSAWLGKPGDTDLGGLEFDEYARRQQRFRQAEIAALRDTPRFIKRAQSLYDYPHFVCDTGGSICEWVDPEDRQDPLLNLLVRHCLLVWIKGDDDHAAELIRRFDAQPKPMAYDPAFLAHAWQPCEDGAAAAPDAATQRRDPDGFIRWLYARALTHRVPRYAAMARNWGVTVGADELAGIDDVTEFNALIAAALEPT